jgi:hypothetical protein
MRYAARRAVVPGVNLLGLVCPARLAPDLDASPSPSRVKRYRWRKSGAPSSSLRILHRLS